MRPNFLFIDCLKLKLLVNNWNMTLAERGGAGGGGRGRRGPEGGGRGRGEWARRREGAMGAAALERNHKKS